MASCGGNNPAPAETSSAPVTTSTPSQSSTPAETSSAPATTSTPAESSAPAQSSTPATTSEQQSSQADSESQSAISSEEVVSSEEIVSSEEESVSVAPVKYGVTVIENEFVNIVVDKAEAEEGETVTIDVTPKNVKVVLDSVLVNGQAIEAVEGVYSFVMPAQAVSVGATAHEKKDIVINQVEGVVLTCDKEFADEGEVVNVDATYDDEQVILERILANNIVLGENEDGTFYFVMPAEDVTIQAVVTIGLTHAIVPMTNFGHAELSVNAGHTGDEITFRVSIEAGYDLVSVAIENVDVIDNGDGTFTFTMPNASVVVEIELAPGEFEIAYNDSHIRSVKYLDPASSADEPAWLDCDGIGGNFFSYGSTIRVEIKDNDLEQVTALTISGAKQTSLAREGDSAFFYFEMPACKITLGVQIQELLHAFVIDQEAAPHFVFSFFRKDAAGMYVPTTGASIYEHTFLKVETADGVAADAYALRSLTLSFKTYTYSEGSLEDRSVDLLKRNTWSMGLNEDGYYEFVLSVSTGEHMATSGDDAKVTLAAVEKDLTTYLGKSWVGSYKGVEPYSTRNGTTFNSSYSPTVDGAGEFTLGGTNFSVLSDDADNKTLHIAKAGNDTEQGIAVYGNKILASYYNVQPSLFQNGHTDLFVGVRLDANINEEDYGVFYDSFTIDSKQYVVVEFTYQNAFYAGAFFDCANETYSLDAQINMLSGTNILEDGATYTITVDGSYVAGFGIANRTHVALDGLQGDYAIDGSEETMHLNGIGHATYLNKDWLYVPVNDEITLINYEDTDLGKVTTTMHITINEGVVTIVSTDVSEPVAYKLEMNTSNISYVGKTHYAWELQQDGTYIPTNSGVKNSAAEMTFTAQAKGRLSFHYECSTEGASYDYFAIYKNGVMQGSKVGGTTTTSKDVEFELEIGDVINFVYVKDGGGDGGIDKAIISNFNYAVTVKDGFQGTYVVDGANVVLDGYGNGAFADGKTFAYAVSGDNAVYEYDGWIYEDDGGTPVHTVITFDKSTKTGTVVQTPTGEKRIAAIDNETLDTGLSMYKGSHVQPNNHFTDNGDGSFTSSNKGLGSSTAEMTIVCCKAGTLTFHVNGGGENGWDTTRIFVNGTSFKDLTSVSYDEDVSITVNAGDRVQICFSKDGSGNTDPDRITVFDIKLDGESIIPATPAAASFSVQVNIPQGWDIQSIYDSDATVFCYVFGGDYESPKWLATERSDDGKVVVTLEEGKAPATFIIVRCAPGTTVETASFNDGVKWNQTGDIAYVAGQVEYSVTLG